MLNFYLNLYKFMIDFYTYFFKYSFNNYITYFYYMLPMMMKFNLQSKYFFKKYIYTMNHKRMGLNYFFFSLWTGLSGGTLASMIRLELVVPGSLFFKGDSLSYLQVVTAHGLIMVFFVVMPILFGGFANFLMPYHMGSKDVAYPRLNCIGFWIQPCGFILMAKIAFLRPQFWKYYDNMDFFFSFYEKNNKSNIKNYEILSDYKMNTNLMNILDFKFLLYFYNNMFDFFHKSLQFKSTKLFFSKCSNSTLVTTGWTFMTPFTSNVKYSGIGAQDVLMVSVIFAGISTTMSFTNLLMTRSTLCMAGMSNRRILLPFMTIGILLSLSMLALITPVLAAAMMMMLLDSHWHTTFFDFAYGGDPILSQHLFWFFGHPEVYVLVMPVFGMMSTAMPQYNLSSLASKHHMIWASYVMCYMGFLVWGHHMYLVGLDHSSSTLYSTVTIMISLPATIKVVNWTFTLINGALFTDVIILFILGFLSFFIVAGFTGMWLSHVGLNISMHDTFYVIAHFHIMLAGAVMSGMFVGFYYYFNMFFGLKFASVFAYLHGIYFMGGQWLTFLPMFYLGFGGMPSRIHDYPLLFAGWNNLATNGHFITTFGLMFFFFMLIDSSMESSYSIVFNFGFCSWHNRILYYLFKMRYLQFYQKYFTLNRFFLWKTMLLNNNMNILLIK